MIAKPEATAPRRFRLDGLAIGWRGAIAGPPAAPVKAPTPVVLELFSSDGCPSCPAATGYLASLDEAQPIRGVSVIVLEETVDYSGSASPGDAGRARARTRQTEYAATLADHRLFTPEVVVGGRAVLDGHDRNQARQLIEGAAMESKAHVMLGRAARALSVEVRDVPRFPEGDVAAVWLAITESGVARSGQPDTGRVTATRAPIVRVLRLLGRMDGATFHAQTELEQSVAWKPQALRAVVFVQLEQSRAILGAATLEAPSPAAPPGSEEKSRSWDRSSRDEEHAIPTEIL